PAAFRNEPTSHPPGASTSPPPFRNEAPLRILYVMDPMTRVLVDKDTTFAFQLEGQRRGHTQYHCEPQDLFVDRTTPHASVRRLEVERAAVHFHLTEVRTAPLRFFDVVFMRKDPPLDMAARRRLSRSQRPRLRRGARRAARPQARAGGVTRATARPPWRPGSATGSAAPSSGHAAASRPRSAAGAGSADSPCAA